jgi:cytochrome c biogenesis protein CcdA/thiol-disulfide isomerase/thioredoxin
MVLLLLFAFVAGAGTAVSPCVLPVLPALLSAGATGGRRRPVGIAIGLAVTFTVTIVGLASVVDGVGLGNDVLRGVAIFVLLAFGLALLMPRAAMRLEEPLAALSRFGPRDKGDGFLSGIVVGGALGFVYAPCAGPILAAVVTVGSASGRVILIALAYAAGSAVVLLALAFGGRWLMDKVRAAGRGPTVQRVLGGVLILTAVVMIAGWDVDLESSIAKHAPDVSLTAGLEDSKAVKKRLQDIQGKAKFDSGDAVAANPGSTKPTGKPSGLPVLGEAPDFVGTQKWFNTPGGKKLTLAQLKGKVVLVDFWTYSCINCLRTLPYLEAWDRKYRKDGLVIVGVHSPEFEFEKDAGNVQDAIRSNGIRYPVAQDNDLATWNAWGNQYWPADYLVDAKGRVRATHFGEGAYNDMEANIRALLAEAGHGATGGYSTPKHVVTPSDQATPETYLGPFRAEGWVKKPSPGTHDFGTAPDTLPLNAFAFGGPWRFGQQTATALSSSSTVDAEFKAERVYLVLGKTPASSGRVRVLLDGKPVTAAQAGTDTKDGVVTVGVHRLYNLVALPSDQQHRLTLKFSPGVTGYAFTFG